MSDVVIKVENVGKQYRLGKVGTGTIATDINRWWHMALGKEDPYLKVGSVNDRTQKSSVNDTVWAIQNINFEVERGEVLGIIGRNGAGKSTLLKILSRVTAPTIGDIKVKGRIASLLEVGTGFHPDLSGRENIFLNGAILGMTKQEIKRKFDEIVDFSGVERYIDTPVKRYSSGMYVRLAFAVAANLESEILIVDEVLAVGDSEFQKKCLGKMKDVSIGQGRTVLFVSHNMAAVKSLCTRGIVLEQGNFAFSGNTEDSVNYYTKTGASLAETPLNERTDRQGNGKLKILDILFLNSLGTQVAELTSGDSYKIQFRFEKHGDIDLQQLTFLMQFKNENDELVSTIASDEQGTVFSEIGSKGRFEVNIPRLIFREGKYTMNYRLSEKPSFTAPHITIDFLTEAVIMNVIRGDFWNSGTLNRPKGFIQDSSIKLIND
jgi:lipopolysaccharide transport system ATP-binding protein